MTPRRRLAGRAGWGLADQALSSLTNFGLGIVVARNVSAHDFGGFSLAFAAFLIVLGVSRAISTEPLLIRHSTTGPEDWREAAGRATGSSLVTGSLAGLGCLVIAVLAGGALGGGFAALAVVLPGLLLQDSWRFAFIAKGEPRSTFLLDLAWTAGLVPAMLVIDQLVHQTSAVVPILVWGLTATAAGVLGTIRGGVLPSPMHAPAWVRRHRDLVPRFVLEALTGVGANQATIFVVGAFAGLAGAGSLRAGQLLLGPMQVLFMAVTLIAIPEAVRLLAQGRDRLLRASILMTVGMSSTVLAWTALVSLLPDALGRALLGDSWPDAQHVILPLGIALAALASGAGAGIGLRALADARGSLRARAYDALANVVLGTTGAVLGGAVGAAWGIAAGAVIGASGYWWVFRRSGRRVAEPVVLP
jgi:O-antigen/teichoic acid export membrane protein